MYTARSLLLAVIVAAAWPVHPAAAIEFVTREAFTVEKSSYKEYPYRVLFEKFHTSQGAEKRALRNVIILKQVFDPEIHQRALAAGATFEAFHGVIKAVNGHRLRLWLPGNDSFKDFPVGIDRIPVKNEHDYPALADNISRFAATVHTLDNRVYKVEIRFALAAPEKPKVLRQGDSNMVSWQPPQTMQTPSAYRVFVNDKPYKTVTGTSVEVPRSKEQADEFFVKAVYTYAKGRVVSAASPTLYDAASAKEIRQRQQAGDLYRQLTTALGRPDLPAARKLLDGNLQLFTDFLSPERKTLARTAATFFKSLDKGERLAALRPETPENLAAAGTAFQLAMNTAARLPSGFNLSPVATARLNQNHARATELTARLLKEKAGKILAQISTDLSPDRWQQARRLLYRQQAFLIKHLDRQEKKGVLALAGFFEDIEKGDRRADVEPLAAEHLEAAMQSYRQAEVKGRSLPDGLDAGFIARQKIKAATNRLAVLEAEENARLAGQVWDKLTLALNPSEWQTAKKLLRANRPLLSAHLPAESKAAMIALVDFFASLDEGDRLAASQPATLAKIDTATGYYRRAARKAEQLPDNLDVDFITRLRTDALQKLQTRLAGTEKTARAHQVYDEIMATLTPTGWKTARALLLKNDAVLATQLDPTGKASVAWLDTFFQFIADGDRLSDKVPVTLDNLNMALSSYRMADQKARQQEGAVDITFISRLKIEENRTRQTALKRKEMQMQALGVLNQIKTALTPADWETAMQLSMNKLTPALEHLEEAPGADARHLVAFFQDITAGDRLRFQQPETDSNLVAAQKRYRQAATRAESLAGRLEVLFIARTRLDDLDIQRAALVKREQARLAALEATRPVPVPPQALPPVPAPAQAPPRAASFDNSVNKTTALKLGLQNFSEQHYDLALRYFEKVYAKKIRKLKKAGRKQSFAVLGLPPRIRAEVIFLVQLDRLKTSSEDDENLLQDGLMALQAAVEDGIGSWSIIPERKRSKIVKHIEHYPY